MNVDNLTVSVSGGSNVTGTMYFTFSGKLTEGEAMNLQEDYGYHPAGYGFYGYTLEGGVTTWNCQRSCD